MRRALYAVLIFLSLVGLAALGVRIREGLAVTNLTSSVSWGMWVAFYIYFIGLSAGSFLLSTLVYVFGMHRFEKIGPLSLLSALFALGAGMLFILIDLGHMERAHYVFLYRNLTSILSWEIHIYLLYIVLVLAELWFLLRCDLAAIAVGERGGKRLLYRVLSLGWPCPAGPAEWQACHAQSMRWVKVLGIVGIPVAVVVHGGTGAIFAVTMAKPYWFSGLFPIIFLVSALASGSALMIFLYAFLGERDEEFSGILRGLADLMVLLISVDLLLLASEFLVGLYGKIPEHQEVYEAILYGPFPYVFWLGQLGLGAVVPILLASLPFTRRSPTWLGLAGLSAVIGIVAVRLNLVIPAYVTPVLRYRKLQG